MSAKPLVIVVVLLLCSVQVSATPAPSVQQGSKLVGSDAVRDANQGYSVALSADGNTAVAGGDFDNNGAGAAWVYMRSGGVWSQQGLKLVGTGAVGTARQGVSVALSADGNTAVVGGVGDSSGVGAAWVFIDPALTAVERSGVPRELALAAPRPNPARGQTVLWFALPEAGPVRVAVYDIEGRRVRTVNPGRLAAGEYQLPLNLREGGARRIPNGLYFVRLEAGGRTLTTRLAIAE